MSTEQTPQPPHFHAATVIATWFGAGYLPLAPGSWGSLAALPFAWVIAWPFGPRVLLFAAVALFFIGWWAAAWMERRTGVADAGEIVVDEVVGQWLTLAVAPRTAAAYVAGFLLFRLFDITKPWPARWADRHLKGGFGVMADDVIAAFYAIAALVVFLLATGQPIG